MGGSGIVGIGGGSGAGAGFVGFLVPCSSFDVDVFVGGA